MKRVITLAAVVMVSLCVSALAQERRSATGAPADVLCGLDVLKRDGFAPLKGKKIAIITNHTARSREGEHIIELLMKAQGVKIVCLFSPEHGLYGAVDEKVGNSTDPKTGLKVWSLYGETRRPTEEMLKGVDTLVFDIADVGARFYTYSATLGICMETAAKNKLAMFVLDRPNPCTGLLPEGPIADKKSQGFTAYGPMPVAHGMTFGELAQMYKGDFGVSECDLHVVKMEGWKRDMWFDETGLMWINPSPNMRNVTQALLYTGTCLLEATNVSVGRGTDQPFELFGAPWIDGRKLSAALNEQKLAGVRFVPIEFTPTSSKFKDQKCQGVFIIVTDRNVIKPVEAGVAMAWTLNKLFGEKFESAKVVRLLQNEATQKAWMEATSPADVAKVWQSDLDAFKKIREKYLIYQ
jgi:uncharacterized protein YbbC (DUF1343 family)